jgi:hypothetical protein
VAGPPPHDLAPTSGQHMPAWRLRLEGFSAARRAAPVERGEAVRTQTRSPDAERGSRRFAALASGVERPEVSGAAARRRLGPPSSRATKATQPFERDFAGAAVQSEQYPYS